jgi:hypothetical protein
MRPGSGSNTPETGRLPHISASRKQCDDDSLQKVEGSGSENNAALKALPRDSGFMVMGRHTCYPMIN